MQAGRLRRDAIIVLVATACSPLIVALGVLMIWAGNPRGVPLGTLFRSLVVDAPGYTVAVVLIMLVCAVSGAVLERWLLRPRLRRVLRRVLRARPDVDPSDPQLAFRARVSVSAEGLESRTGIGATFLRWEVLMRWEELGGLLMVLGDAMVGFCIRTSAADPASLDRMRAILTARLGPALNRRRA